MYCFVVVVVIVGGGGCQTKEQINLFFYCILWLFELA